LCSYEAQDETSLDELEHEIDESHLMDYHDESNISGSGVSKCHFWRMCLDRVHTCMDGLQCVEEDDASDA
jgi:ribosome assembly protein YihI (activator of Der GTPase)